ncbi:MAG: hypothetical protein KGD59_08245 [Candidatus Heimdallarchaeota archaeon]|nr:hypothetical protein [Candidatus Heimdallarchaeota archaeon]MBY8994527.1 hypothetical protein [Candidatus Heimdallarchaeota archaeon]
MKFSLSIRTLKKILIGTTVINYIILVAYIFLIVSITFFDSYAVFLLSLPAYVLSKSWMLILGFFGFEGLLLVYYWYKNKNSIQTENLVETTEIILDEDIFKENNEIFSESGNSIEDHSIEKIGHHEIDLLDEIDEMIPVETPLEQDNLELIEAEKEFDKLWEEAIDHVKSAYKKKAGESLSVISSTEEENELNLQLTNNTNRKKSIGNMPEKSPRSSKTSRAISVKSKLKRKKNLADVSLIKDHHREFYNEVAMNNWIYQRNSDRDRVGLYKLSLDETRFREKEISYLIDVGILHKLLIPFPSGSFVVFSLYEGEDKKIINNYLAKLCKRNGLKFTQKSIAFVNYTDLGLDRKNWRFDFHVNNSIVGLIWLSNFLIEDDQTRTVSIAYQQKKELKALLATAQINHSNKNMTALVITDYNSNKEIIENHIETIGFGQATIFAVGEQNFESQIMKELKSKISA